MDIEFRLLGEVEVWVDGTRLDVGHVRQRSVLVCLLVDVNRAVSSEQLIDRVWADEPPHKPRNALAAYISRLRQLFAGIDDVAIERGPGGYTLRAPERWVDLYVFRDLVSRARVVAGAAEVMDMLDAAMRLWRGEPFSTIDTPWANEVRASLEAEHLSVILDRNDAALAAGRHGGLLVELTATAQQHPLDERIAGQLMLAQYRSGRQADALETYRATRDRVVAELGVDPSPTLQEVHRQILDGDPARPVSPPSPPPGAAPRAVGTTGAGVPRRATRLVGRDEDVRRVAAVVAGSAVITLTGVGGVGKTRFALETAGRVSDKFPDGVWVCELAPLADGAAVGQAVATTLRVQRSRAQEFTDAVVDYLRPLELLLVMDNCEHVLPNAAALIDEIVRKCPRTTVLATSREPLGVEGERVVPVQPLSEHHAVELFVERAKASRPDFDPDREPIGTVAEICRRIDRVPLAIELAAARVRAMSSLDIARRLDRLRLLSGGARGAHPRQQSVAATVDWSYRLLTDHEKRLFARLSVFAGGFDVEAAHVVCADQHSTEDDTLELLTGLVDKSMVVVRGGTAVTRYDVLETLRAYGRERLRDNGLADELAARHARYYTELIARAAAGVHGPDEAAWVERMTPRAGTTYTATDYDNLRAAFEWARETRDIDLVLELVTSLPEVIHLRTGYHSVEWAERAIELADPGHPLFAAAVGSVARGAWVLGEFSHARALALLADGHVPPAGTSYLAYPTDVVADAARYEGDVPTALAYYRDEAAAVHSCGDPLRLVLILDRITLCHQALGAPEAGRDAAEEAVRIADATANPSARSLARSALGRALSGSDPARALRLFGEASELAASVENNWLTGVALMETAAILAVHDDPGPAARMFVSLLDHWAQGGPGLIALQWDALRDVTRFLVRLGAPEAPALHWALVGAGQKSPLQTAAAAGPSGAALTGTEAVDLARETLLRYC